MKNSSTFVEQPAMATSLYLIYFLSMDGMFKKKLTWASLHFWKSAVSSFRVQHLLLCRKVWNILLRASWVTADEFLQYRLLYWLAAGLSFIVALFFDVTDSLSSNEVFVVLNLVASRCMSLFFLFFGCIKDLADGWSDFRELLFASSHWPLYRTLIKHLKWISANRPEHP